LQSWNCSAFFGVGTRTEMPPPTKRRERDCLDPIEELWYIKDRQTRIMTYYRDSTRVALQNLTWQLLMVTLGVRLACIWVTGFASLLKSVFGMVGFHGLMTAQETWYAGQWNMVDESMLRGIGKFAWTLLDAWLVALPDSMKQFAVLWAVGLILWVICVTAISSYLVFYRRAFNKEWFNNGDNGQKVADKNGEMIDHCDFGQECRWVEKPKAEEDDSIKKTKSQAELAAEKEAEKPVGRKMYTSRGSVFFDSSVEETK